MAAEAVTLAHLARPLALSRALDPKLYKVHLACDPRYDNFLPNDIPVTRMHSIPGQQFLNALSRGDPVYDAKTLSTQVKEDLDIIEALDPDVIVGDFRLSLSISARLARKPYITITNAYWSPYAQHGYPLPELPWVPWVGIPIASTLFKLARPLAFRLHAQPMNKVRRRYGLPSQVPSLQRFYTDADYTLYADIPDLFPLPDLPDQHRFIGAVLWEPPMALPEWWDTLTPNRPIIFVTLGSSGQARLLPKILEALSATPVQIIAASAGRISPTQRPANARVANYLPGIQAARRASLVICNGGSPTSQQALVAGVPVLGLCSNMDQYMNMEAIQRAGAGELLRAGKANVSSIRHAAQTLLSTPSYKLSAERLRDSFTKYPSLIRFRSVVDQALSEAAHNP